MLLLLLVSLCCCFKFFFCCCYFWCCFCRFVVVVVVVAVVVDKHNYLFFGYKLWMMKGQIHEEANETYEATQAYRNGVSISFIHYFCLFDTINILCDSLTVLIIQAGYALLQYYTDVGLCVSEKYIRFLVNKRMFKVETPSSCDLSTTVELNRPMGFEPASRFILGLRDT